MGANDIICRTLMTVQKYEGARDNKSLVAKDLVIPEHPINEIPANKTVYLQVCTLVLHYIFF
jgi:hypothetical protein